MTWTIHRNSNNTVVDYVEATYMLVDNGVMIFHNGHTLQQPFAVYSTRDFYAKRGGN